MATHSSVPAWTIPWAEKPGGLQSTGHKELDLTERLGMHAYLEDQNYLTTHEYYGEGNGTPLQYSCLENPMDGGAWKAAVHGVTESRTRLSDFTFTFHFSLSCIGGGNGNPLQCSCLENPRDSGAWWAAVYGVSQSRTQLK